MDEPGDPASCSHASGTNRIGYASDLRDKAKFQKAVVCARNAYENRRRRFPALLSEDYTTIAAVALRDSFWPFNDHPYCVVVNRAARYPCNTDFPNKYSIEVPRYPGSHWDFLHQLAHWCLPLEGHNEHFCSFYAALVHVTFGRDGSRRLCRVFNELEIAFNADWHQPIRPRPEFLRPFESSRRNAGSEPVENEVPEPDLRRYGT